MVKWGYNEIEGLEFFLEPDNVPELFPYELPTFECPHTTYGKPMKSKREGRVFVLEEKPVIPNVEWYDDVYYTTLSSTVSEIKKKCSTTGGYVPLVVRNVPAFEKWLNLFGVVRSVAMSERRDVVFIGNPKWLILPEFVRTKYDY